MCFNAGHRFVCFQNGDVMSVASPGWTNSPSRTVNLPLGSLTNRDISQPLAPLSWGSKNSENNIDYYLDPQLALNEVSDALLSAEVSVDKGSATDLEIVLATLINGMLMVILGGGELGNTYTIGVKLFTRMGRILYQPMVISIGFYGEEAAAKSPPKTTNGVSIPPNAIRLPSGDILLDEKTGLPLIIF